MAEWILSIPNDRAGGIAVEWLRNRAERTRDLRYIGALPEMLRRTKAGEALFSLNAAFHLLWLRDDIDEALVRDFLGIHTNPGATEGDRGHILSLEPNAAFTLCAPPNGALSLQADHAVYMKQMDIAAAHGKGNYGKGGHIAVIDTGCDGPRIDDFYDLAGPTLHPGSTGAVDKVGHGTAMATIIREVAPDCTLTVIRTADSTNIPLWHLLAAIVLAVFDAQAEILNLSLGRDNLSGVCTRCGASSAARSIALEYLMKALRLLAPSYLPNGQPPTYVAATGNDGTGSGFFLPARYDCALAVGAVNAAAQRSEFSTYGSYLHTHHLMAPGGETNRGVPAEWAIADTAQEYYGTSISAAYTSGILALLRTDHSSADLRTLALSKVVAASPSSVCGSGQVRYS